MKQFQMENQSKKGLKDQTPKNMGLNNPQNTNLRLCINHNKDLVFFCESCDEPICENCTYLGPHNTQMHRIVNLDVAYSSRVAKLGH